MKAILLIIVLTPIFTGCAGYGVGGGLSFTNTSGETFSGNITVTKLSDGKTIIAPVKK